jgi:nucleotide-binding universal stress UspA family protein
MVMMFKILAPTRGGEASCINQDKAIAMAKERGAALDFLYVTDTSFLNRVSSPVLIDVEEELDEMGGFMLAMAQERAKAQGVEAGAVIRRGHFGDVLRAVIEELEIDCLILGGPEEESGITTYDFLRGLAEELASTHNVETVVLAKGEVVYEHKPGQPQ